MAEEKPITNQPAPPAKSSNPCLIIGIIIAVVIIILIIAGYFGLAWILRKVNQAIPSFSPTPSASASTQSGITDEDLIGSWDTGCLVPDQESPWAERHTFVINSNGTANHKRYSGESCASLSEDQNDNINYVIPAKNEINLTYTSGIASGTTVYDIYDIADNTLRFGHGFCNCTTSGGKYGSSELDRFILLNNFLAYHKQ